MVTYTAKVPVLHAPTLNNSEQISALALRLKYQVSLCDNYSADTLDANKIKNFEQLRDYQEFA
jgi:hypothetical protein